jgi:hypothetical protein
VFTDFVVILHKPWGCRLTAYQRWGLSAPRIFAVLDPALQQVDNRFFTQFLLYAGSLSRASNSFFIRC